MEIKKIKLSMNGELNMSIKGLPTLEKANNMLEEAAILNPGKWIDHSKYVAEGAKLIAECCNLDGEKAYILGLLHDIGRRYGITGLRHSIDGYNFCRELGYDLCARISLTHNFPAKDLRYTVGEWDCSEEEYNFVQTYIEDVEYDNYDKLVQLCDAIALPEGFTLMEKRLMDIALRHGVSEYAVYEWKKNFELKKYFEDIMGKSIYSILPKVVENTFEGAIV